MIRILKNSLAFRSGKWYEWILSKMTVSQKSAKLENDLIFLTLTGKNQLNMLNESILSLYLSNEILPQIKIFSDGSISKAQIIKILSWYPNSIEVIEKETCLHYHAIKGRDKLVAFANKNPMGLKLASILQMAEFGVAFYSDTDVLFYKSLINVLDFKMLLTRDFYLAMSLDFQQAYDQNLVENFFKDLSNSPYYCAGILFIKGDLFDNYSLEKILEECIENSNHFSEQTIFAGINRYSENNYFDPGKVVCYQSDAQTLEPTFLNKFWVARHYVGSVRHLFWRDALFLRLGFKTN